MHNRMSAWTVSIGDLFPKVRELPLAATYLRATQETLLTASGLDKYLEEYPKIIHFYNVAEDIFLKFYHLIPRADSIAFLADKNIYLITIVSCLLYNVLYIALTRIEYSHNVFKKVGASLRI